MAKILVADDNSNIQKMVSLALQDQGIEVVAVGNGEAAVRKLSDIHPDLVLADVFMPVRNGYEVCEFVKSDPRFAQIPVILLVGAFDPLDEQEAQRVGADGVLKKPFVPPDPLVSMVKTALAKADHQRTAPVQAAVPKAAPAPPAVPPPELQPTPTPEPEFDTPTNEFRRAPERFSFSEHEKPVAFGELLETSAPETSSEPAARGPIGTSPNAYPFGKFPTSEEAAEEAESSKEPPWRESGETLPRRGDAALLRDAEPPVEEAEPNKSEESTGQHAADGTLPELIESANEWLADASAHPPEPLPTSEEDSWIAAPTVESAPPPAEPATSEAAPPPPEPAPTSAGLGDGPARKVNKHLTESWPPVPPPPAWEPPPAARQPLRSITPSPEEIASAVNSFELPNQPDPALVDAVVARVLERMQPRIMDVVTKEILRPVVEALVRRELDKH